MLIYFIKVGIIGNSKTIIQATSSNTIGQIFGIRRDIVDGNEEMASSCIEFKCR